MNKKERRIHIYVCLYILISSAFMHTHTYRNASFARAEFVLHGICYWPHNYCWTASNANHNFLCISPSTWTTIGNRCTIKEMKIYFQIKEHILLYTVPYLSISLFLFSRMWQYIKTTSDDNIKCGAWGKRERGKMQVHLLEIL